MTVADSTDPVAESNVRVIEAIERLSGDVAKALRASARKPSIRPSRLRESPATDNSLDDDLRSVVKIVNNVRNRGALTLPDLENSISRLTSTDLDGWARESAKEIEPSMSDDDIDAVLLSDDLFRSAEDDDPHVA
jgi:hypothetical protein